MSTALAQSNLTYELRIGATRDVALLEEFPESFAGEKVNVTLANGSYTTFGTLETPDVLKPLDFFFADLPSPALTAWGDSIYSYTDAEGTTWTVWRTKKEVKNRGQKVFRQNAYTVFETYVQN
ncbi:MAG: hypothetical protein IKP02_02395, partial [Paludibacteraceae bacterium]|nr:hypothetical protein [Paludibacteraceae bacterium]